MPMFTTWAPVARAMAPLSTPKARFEPPTSTILRGTSSRQA